MSELRECPFCNSDEIESHADNADGWVIYCGSCTASISESKEAFAIAAWNRRAPVAEAGDVVELVKQLRQEQPATQDWASTAQCELQDQAADLIDSLTAREAALREAMEKIEADASQVRKSYELHGPEYTSRESGREYYMAVYVLEVADELAEIARAALARK